MHLIWIWKCSSTKHYTSANLQDGWTNPPDSNKSLSQYFTAEESVESNQRDGYLSEDSIEDVDYPIEEKFMLTSRSHLAGKKMISHIASFKFYYRDTKAAAERRKGVLKASVARWREASAQN